MADAEVQRVNDNLQTVGVNIFVTDGNDVEHSFVSASHIAVVTGLELERVEARVSEAIKHTRDTSIRAIINQRPVVFGAETPARAAPSTGGRRVADSE
jgi:hypothetical protein